MSTISVEEDRSDSSQNSQSSEELPQFLKLMFRHDNSFPVGENIIVKYRDHIGEVNSSQGRAVFPFRFASANWELVFEISESGLTCSNHYPEAGTVAVYFQISASELDDIPNLILSINEAFESNE